MTTSVLIINRQLVFAVTIKQALEQTGAFEVHAFTSVDAALDYLRDHPHDVALVDFTIPEVPGPQIVRRLRMVQADLAVIISPAQEDKDLIRRLDIQGVIDAPFTARAIIPLIENAVSQIEEPLVAITRSFEEQQPELGETEVLTEDHYRSFGPDDAPDPDAGGDAGRTRALDDADLDAAFDQFFAPAPPSRPVDRTRILDEVGDEFDEFFGTPAPSSLPEFSSLDDVLTSEAPSEMFEPERQEGDTPAVPDFDSDAMRQFLATRPDRGDETFDAVLGSIDPTEADAAEARSDFQNLVDSMRGSRAHTPLPDRHQQFIEFILTGGMDNLLTEIERARPADEEDEAAPVDEAPPAPVDSFARLAAEEPPPPLLEESGTIGDLMIGVSDPSFRDVLAMMRGEEVAPPEEVDAAFDAFFDRQITREQPTRPHRDAFRFDDEEPEVSPTQFIQQQTDLWAEPEMPEPVEESGSIPAQLILETALDETVPPDSFSLDNLISDIERQLNQHEPQIRPLPSWGGAIRLPRRPRRRSDLPAGVEEPDFLPEEFPTGASKPVSDAPPAEEPAPRRAIRPLKPRRREEKPPVEPPPPVAAGPFVDLPPEWAEEAETFAEPESPVEPVEPVPQWDEPSPWDAAQPTDEPSYDWAALSAEIAEGEPEDESDVLPAEVLEDAPLEDDWDVPAAPPEEDWDAAPAAVVGAWDQPAEPPLDLDLMIDEGLAHETVLMSSREAESLMAAGPSFVDLASAERLDDDDPYIAQLALSLTQVSLELTAEATLLTRGARIMAYAGQLPQAEVEELSAAIADDWEANPDEARVRFIRLASSGADYMLYSRRTEGDFTLSMIFAASTPLRDIRRQGKRLVEVLQAVPDTVDAPLAVQETAPPPASEVSAPYAYVWLLADPDRAMSEAAAWAVVSGLSTQLNEQGWEIRQFIARDEYVYLLADVPGERPAYSVIDELKRRSADILRRQDPVLSRGPVWADSYLVMTPGRELDPDEIFQFINFQRTL